MAIDPKQEQAARPHVTVRMSPTYKTVYVDQSAVRIERGQVFVTFFSDDRILTGFTTTPADGGRSYLISGSAGETHIRWQEAAARMTIDEAIALASLMLGKIEQEAPDHLKEKNIQVEFEQSPSGKERT